MRTRLLPTHTDLQMRRSVDARVRGAVTVGGVRTTLVDLSRRWMVVHELGPRTLFLLR
jgi:hypothetical protein